MSYIHSAFKSAWKISSSVEVFAIIIVNITLASASLVSRHSASRSSPYRAGSKTSAIVLCTSKKALCPFLPALNQRVSPHHSPYLFHPSHLLSESIFISGIYLASIIRLLILWCPESYKPGKNRAHSH